MPGHRVAGRPARRLDRRPHHPIKRIGALGIDQRHRSLDQRLFLQKRFIGTRDHIDNRIANTDNINTSLRHLRMNYLSEELRAAEYRG